MKGGFGCDSVGVAERLQLWEANPGFGPLGNEYLDSHMKAGGPKVLCKLDVEKVTIMLIRISCCIFWNMDLE